MQFSLDTQGQHYDCEVAFAFNSTHNNTLLTQVENRFLCTIHNKEDALKENKIISTISNLSAILNQAQIQSVILPALNEKFVALAARTLIASNYQVCKPHKEHTNTNTLQTVAFHTDDDNYQEVLRTANAIGEGMNLTKHLADMPSNICTPKYLATVVEELAQTHNLECEVLGEAEMEVLGMGSLLSVAKGSIHPPQLITLKYTGNGDAPPIVLVGKGVTFDSGGISIKPGANMDEMKYDMTGGASVLGTMQVIASLQAKVNLVVVIAAVENMPAHNASKPGDVVKSMSGQTIEILNTDAEGRLILCDALTYAKKHHPKVIIDIATLTGAVIIALGKHHSGVMGNNQKLINTLIESGKNTQDTLWQLPLDEEYDEQLQSNFADMANIGGREAGTVTAACFLARFTQEENWAHLDIAGTAWISGKNKGATGRPVPLLCEYILSNC